MPETFLNKAQLTGLSKDARRTEILRAKGTASLDSRLTAAEVDIVATEDQLAGLPSLIHWGASAATSATGGVFTLTFASAFAANPVIAVTGTSSDTVSLYISSRSTTGFTVTVPGFGAGFSRTFHYVAVGTAP